MLSFHPINISDKEHAEKILVELKSFFCAHWFVDLFIWKSVYNTEVCFQDEFFFIKQESDGETIYTIPLGTGNLKNAVEALRQDAKDRNAEFLLHAINEEQKAKLEEIFPNEFEFSEERDSEDYIYTAESLITLAGKKLHSKRNFVNRFKEIFDGRWSYEDISKENIHDVFKYHLSWCAQNSDDDSDEFFGETCAISFALNNFEELDLKGGLIRIDGNVIAFTLGSKVNDDLFIVHIEKADFSIAGAYQMINNQFAIRNFDGIKYINREEDLGKEGLRKAKLSYHPVMLAQNFTAFPKSTG